MAVKIKLEKKSPKPKDVPKGYKFQKFADNQDMFRVHHFKRYARDWSLWKPLQKPVFAYLRKPSSQGSIKLNAREQAHVQKLLEKRCTKRELAIIKDLVDHHGPARALNEALFVELSKEYPLAYKAANKQWLRSKFRYDWEFFAIHYGLIKSKEFTHIGESAPR